MVEQGGGHVINLGSIAGSYNYPGGNAYGATKAFGRFFNNIGRNSNFNLLATNQFINRFTKISSKHEIVIEQ